MLRAERRELPEVSGTGMGRHQPWREETKQQQIKHRFSKQRPARVHGVLLAKLKLQAWQAELTPGPAARCSKITSLHCILLPKCQPVMVSTGETLAASACCSACLRAVRQPGKHWRREAKQTSATAACSSRETPELPWPPSQGSRTSEWLSC